jgi:hypothetical protein
VNLVGLVFVALGVFFVALRKWAARLAVDWNRALLHRTFASAPYEWSFLVGGALFIAAGIATLVFHPGL